MFSHNSFSCFLRDSLICHEIMDIGAVEVHRGTMGLVNYITFHRLPRRNDIKEKEKRGVKKKKISRR